MYVHTLKNYPTPLGGIFSACPVLHFWLAVKNYVKSPHLFATFKTTQEATPNL